MGVFLIDSWDLKKQEKQIEFLRQAVFIRGKSSNWVILSDMLSGFVNPLEYFFQTTCHKFRGTCSRWRVFTDMRYIFFKKILFSYSRFSGWKKMIDSSCVISFWGKSCRLWLLFPFMEFSVYGKKYAKYSLQVFRHYFICLASINSLQSLRFLRLLCQTPIIEMLLLNRNE